MPTITSAYPSRRMFLQTAVGSTALTLAGETRAADAPPTPFQYCLNTSTISGANLSLRQEIDIAHQTGYAAIEPWIRELEAHQQSGGTLTDLRKQLDDSGLKVADAIGFASWVVDDQTERDKALEQLKREMDWVAQIGGQHIAAPPAGAKGSIAVERIAERYAAVVDLGKRMGVMPLLELWGFARILSRLDQVASVAIDCGRSDAALLLDIYHLYKGGSDFAGLAQLNGQKLPVIHVNDYPANPPRHEITDAFRVFPGDGVAPLKEIFQTLRASGCRAFLSLELFNRDYWKQSPLKVAKEGLEKLKKAAEEG